ncbi:MAG TPA: ParM/StbA family protein [Aggregatilineales bacterium]|nr:ParM/StbA family protein [Anaerolineae bacterium]HUN09090.1 ParM/StbA family protein [Aggregatilineales bacterium]
MNKRKTGVVGVASGGGMPSMNVLTVGLDVGYGVVKAVTDTSEISFPSVSGHAREIKFQAETLASRYPGDQLIDEEGHWFVGDLALNQLPAGEILRLRGRTANEATMGNAFRLRLAKAALGKLLGSGVGNGDVVHLRLASGLPVDYMRDAGEFKAGLVGQHRIQTDAADFVVNITEVMVMPQPYGSAYAMMLTPAGEINVYHTWMRTGVCDVGTYTVDLVLDDDGDYVDAESGSVESGVYTAQERIAAMLERDYREKIPHKIVESVLKTGMFTAHGKTIDYRSEVEEALQPLRSATLNLMSEKWQRGTTVDVIYLSGGGAELVYEEVYRAYPQTKLVPQAQMANARGYLYYANFMGRTK